MSIEQNLCKVKIFQLQSMLNAIRLIDQRFAFKNSGIACLDIPLEKSKYDSPVKKIVCRWRDMTSHITFFWSN